MKVLIVYDSKTGNTEKMAHAVAEGVKREGVEVDIRKVEEASVDKLLGADALHSRAQGVKVELNSPLDPRTNPLARELSYLFKVKKMNLTTPVLFIDSDHERFVLARMAKPGEEVPIESAIFSNDSKILSLISLLMIRHDHIIKQLTL